MPADNTTPAAVDALTARGVQANMALEAAEILGDLNKAFAEHSETVTKRLDKIEQGGQITPENVEKIDKLGAEMLSMQEELDKLNKQFAAQMMAGRASLDDSKARAALNKFLRVSTRENGLAMSADAQMVVTAADDTQGGYFVPPEINTQLGTLINDMGAVSQVAQVITTGSSGFKSSTRTKKVEAKWVGELGDRGDTDTGEWAMTDIPVHELSAEPEISSTMLEDSIIDLTSFFVEEAGMQFATAEGRAFMHGTGQLQPQGILTAEFVDDANWTWGKIGRFKTGAANGFKASSSADPSSAPIVRMIKSLRSGYAAMGVGLLANRHTIAVLMNLVDERGRPLWHPSLDMSEPSTFSGVRVRLDDFVPNVEANAIALVLLAYSGYLITRRRGTMVLRDPYSKHPSVIFRTTQRTGGGIMNYEAIKVLQAAA